MDEIPKEIREIAGDVVQSELSWLADFLMIKFGLKTGQVRALIEEKLPRTV